jgi:threonine dehydrogenase-like Zn-dependent dehydrogenase
MGSRNATAADFLRSIELIETGHAAVTDWITHRTTLDGVPAFFPSLEHPDSGVLKAIVDV